MNLTPSPADRERIASQVRRELAELPEGQSRCFQTAMRGAQILRNEFAYNPSLQIGAFSLAGQGTFYEVDPLHPEEGLVARIRRGDAKEYGGEYHAWLLSPDGSIVIDFSLGPWVEASFSAMRWPPANPPPPPFLWRPKAQLVPTRRVLKGMMDEKRLAFCYEPLKGDPLNLCFEFLMPKDFALIVEQP